MASDAWRLYEVTVDRGQGDYSSSLYSAPSRSKAMAEAWRSFSEVWEIGFGDFLKIARVRLNDRAPPNDCYDYVRCSYGLAVKIGDRVRLKDEGSSTGLEGVVVYPGGSTTARVHVVIDGRSHACQVHPYSLDVIGAEVRAHA